MDEITVLAPASVGNLTCGFDCLGAALDEPCDEMTLRRTDDAGAVRIIHRDSFGLPEDPEKNAAGAVLRAMLAAARPGFGFELEIDKRIKPGSGIGSSAASSAGAARAANELLGGRFSRAELVGFAMEGERLASGSVCPDNVAPCIYGGITLVRPGNPPDVAPVRFPPLHVALLHPQIELRTSDSRKVLPREIPLTTAVEQLSYVGTFIAGLEQGDYGLIGRSLVDRLAEPVRRDLIPAFGEVREQSLRAGALGGGISGSGPSVYMLCETRETARKVGEAMTDIYAATGLDFNVYVTEINREGVKVRPKDQESR